MAFLGKRTRSFLVSGGALIRNMTRVGVALHKDSAAAAVADSKTGNENESSTHLNKKCEDWSYLNGKCLLRETDLVKRCGSKISMVEIRLDGKSVACIALRVGGETKQCSARRQCSMEEKEGLS